MRTGELAIGVWDGFLAGVVGIQGHMRLMMSGIGRSRAPLALRRGKGSGHAWVALIGALVIGGALAAEAAGGRVGLTFCCSAGNDLYQALSGSRLQRFDTPAAAIEKAEPGTGVLLLADGYPERAVSLDAAGFALAQKKQLRLFIEYPAGVPGLVFAAGRTSQWERVVVASERFAPALARMRILSAHGCRFVPVENAAGAAAGLQPDLVMARVAGYDTAVFGLPEKGAFPILFRLPERQLWVATTKLSGFVTGRFAPAHDWELVWQRLLSELAPGGSFRFKVKPVVEAAYRPGAKLPRNYQRQALAEAARWVTSSHLLVHPQEWPALKAALAPNGESAGVPRLDAPEGDGSLGILEGYSSGIQWDGSQERRAPLRADCHAESAMVLAMDGRLGGHKRNALIASNLLDFVYFNSGMCQGVRADPQHGAFGLIGWGDVAPNWMVANYGDDNARVMLATAVAAATLQTDHWDQRLMRALLANLRTTGKLGFRTDRIDVPGLQQNGWKPYYEGAPIDYSPHFEAYLWACYLWAYHHTGFEPFLERASTAIGMTMTVYPGQWRWQDNLERAHMLLCLAWLVRVQDTAEHREWLNHVAGDLLKDQQPSGSIRESLGNRNSGGFRTPQSNEEYGTGETPLVQVNGDPVSDQLYTTGFALLGLHEAVGATGDPKLQQAEDRLAAYLCRIQTRSQKFPYLNGTWFRAFDDRRWEAWASSADAGWGAWSLEAGWAQAWTAAMLGVREMHTTIWDFTEQSRVREHFPALRAQMLPEP